MNRSLFLAALLVVGCSQQVPAVDDAAHRATSEPRATATPPTSTASPPASASAGTARRTPFGTNLAHAPRDPNSVFMHPATEFLAKLRSHGYVLAPTQLPEPSC